MNYNYNPNVDKFIIVKKSRTYNWPTEGGYYNSFEDAQRAAKAESELDPVGYEAVKVSVANGNVLESEIDRIAKMAVYNHLQQWPPCRLTRMEKENKNLRNENERIVKAIKKDLKMAFSIGVIPRQYEQLSHYQKVSFEKTPKGYKATIEDNHRKHKTCWWEDETIEVAMDGAYHLWRYSEHELGRNLEKVKTNVIYHEAEE